MEPLLGNDWTFTTNDVGDTTGATDGNGNTTSYGYDNLHRVTQVTFPDIGAGQKSRSFTWQCCGLTQVTDENGVVTKYEYDFYTKWLKKVTENYGGTNPSPIVSECTYDEVGNPKTVKNGRGKTTTYTYDDADRLTRIDYPDATYGAWTYRDDGRIASYRDGRGRVTQYRYDADDRVWGPAGSGYVAINYPNDTDVNISRDKDGLVTSFADASGTTAVAYYPSQWVKSVQNGYGKKVEYEYNGVGDLSKLWASRSPDKWFTYAYNARNQTTSVTDQNGTTLSSFGYDNGGRRTTVTRPGSYCAFR